MNLHNAILLSSFTEILLFQTIGLSLLVYKLYDCKDGVCVVTMVSTALETFPDPLVDMQLLFIG